MYQFRKQPVSPLPQSLKVWFPKNQKSTNHAISLPYTLGINILRSIGIQFPISSLPVEKLLSSIDDFKSVPTPIGQMSVPFFASLVEFEKTLAQHPAGTMVSFKLE